MDRKGTAIGPRRCGDLLRGFASLSDEERNSWASVPSDWRIEGEFDYHECRTLGEVLAWAALIETGVVEFSNGDRLPIREGFLNALDSFAEGDLVPVDTLERVMAGIPPRDRDRSEVDYYEVFAEKIREFHADPARPDPHALPPSPYPAGTTIGPARCIELIRGLTSTWEPQRHAWSGTVAAWISRGELDHREATTLAGVLGWVLVIESEARVRAGLLASLAALARRDLVPTVVLEQVVAAIPAGTGPADARAVLAGTLERHRSGWP